jgi:hypothetical protein
VTVTPSSVQTVTATAERPAPPFPPLIVEEALKLLVKALRAHQLYLHNNPTYLRAIEVVRGAFATIWTHTDELVLTITETDLKWSGLPVLDEPTKSSDSLPWVFYKDGIRELSLVRGFETDELVGLLDIIQRVRKASPEEDDLLTMLWEKDFGHIRYRYVDLAIESAPALDALPPEPGAAPTVVAVQEEETIDAARPGVVSLEDFDSTLYFLDEKEIEYLRGEVRSEYDADLRRNILAMLFDIYEQQTEGTVREEIAGILESFILHLLSAGQFRAVAYLLGEAGATSERSRTLSPAQKERLARLPERLSAEDSLAQLLQALDEAADLPPQTELNELFDQLRPTALGPVFTWLGKLENAKLRVVLETAASRLAAANTAELVRLIGSPDPGIALEAIRRAGGLKSAAAVAPLAKVMVDGDATTRLAAVQALAEIGSPSALQGLERAVDDSERDVRVSAARALAARGYRPAVPRLEGVVRGKAIREADLTEKMALFEAYGALCGDTGIKILDEILNAKGFLGKREEPELRACAAMALGKIASEAAVGVLRKASGEKEVLVRNAVNRALRGGGP